MSSTLYKLFTGLELTPKTNKKIEMLTNYNPTILLRVLEMALNPFKTYGYTVLPDRCETDNEMTLDEALDVVESNLEGNQRSLTRTALISNLLGSLSEGDADVLSRVILKDFRCGVGATIVNKIWNKHIPIFKVLLAQPGKEKNLARIVYPAYSQLKYDGGRVNIDINEDGEVIVYSRNGRILNLRGKFDNQFPNKAYNNMLDGELVAMRNGVRLPRKESNGIVTKAIRGSITQEEIDLLHFVCWDIVDRDNFLDQIELKIPCSERYATIVELLTDKSDLYSVAECRLVNSFEEAVEHYNECIERGEEGIIIKNIAGFWKAKRSNDLVKMKAEEMADLIVIDVIEGSGKYKIIDGDKMVGAFILETSDGLLRVRCGSGLTDKQRVQYWNEKPIGKIVEVKYNEIIERRDSETKSLFLPIFQKIRDDKDVANTINELK